jgi:hypothetical protein
MTISNDAKLIAQELGRISPLVGYAVALSEKVDGAQPFLFKVTRRLTTDEMISICRDMSAVIRREMPERPDGWAALILADQYGASVMGSYFVGWAGRADEWRLRKGQERKASYYPEFLALRDRLRGALTTLGTEGARKGDGDFRVVDGEIGRFTQTVFVSRPEFLTTDFIKAIQNVLRDSSDEWAVHVRPSFGPPFETLWEGIDVRVGSVVEKWDREDMEQVLGDRLKIPRYTRDS